MNITRFRKRILFALLVLIPLGFLTKFYRGPWQQWFNFYFGGVLYEIFWCLVIAFLAPDKSKIIIVLGVLIITCGLEFLQLYSHPVLEYIRCNFWGRILIGHSFSWYDFPYYIAGSALGYFLLIKLERNIY